MKAHHPVALAVLSLVAFGCGRHREPPPPREAHPDVPFAAAQLSTDYTPMPTTVRDAPSRSGPERVQQYPPLVLPPAPDVKAARFIALLPQPPKGWWGEQANVETSLVDDKSHWQTMAHRSYARTWSQSSPSVGMAIRTDWGASSALKDELDAACGKYGAACTPITTSIGSGTQTVVEASKATEIAVLVEPNVVVQAWGNGVTADELKAWVERVDKDAIHRIVLP